MVYTYNKGIGYLGIEIIDEYINYINNVYKLPFISIGSGNGFVENKNSLCNWICIDPNPLSYLKNNDDKIYKNPDYKTCEELISAKPEIIGNNVLFLNWCDPNDSTYDYDAIILLKPKAILVVHEICDNDDYGAAGGKKFNNLYKQMKVGEDKNYEILYESNTYNDSFSDILDPYITWINETPNNLDSSNINIQRHIFIPDHQLETCSIM